MVTRPRTAGFTLIELMIGIAIMALLLLTAAPFTSAWVDGARQMRARSTVIEAVGQARALAMRNPDAAAAGEPVAAVLYQADANALCVVTRSAGPGAAWRADSCLAAGKDCRDEKAGKAADGVSWLGCIANPGRELVMKVDAIDFLCVAYDSRGRQRESADLATGTCVAPGNASVSIAVGSQESVDAPLL